MTVAWSDSLSVGVKEIDDQHRQFISIMNSLYTGISSPDLKKIIGDILEQLVSYAKYHFATEEKYFDQFEYPEAADHKQKHRELTASIIEFQKSTKEPANIAMELMDFLENWLVEHLGDYDKHYTDFFHKHGLY